MGWCATVCCLVALLPNRYLNGYTITEYGVMLILQTRKIGRKSYG